MEKADVFFIFYLGHGGQLKILYYLLAPAAIAMDKKRESEVPIRAVEN